MVDPVYLLALVELSMTLTTVPLLNSHCTFRIGKIEQYGHSNVTEAWYGDDNSEKFLYTYGVDASTIRKAT